MKVTKEYNLIKKINFTCKNCGEEWEMGLNRINKQRFTTCPNCHNEIDEEQKKYANEEMNKIKKNRRRWNILSNLK